MSRPSKPSTEPHEAVSTVPADPAVANTGDDVSDTAATAATDPAVTPAGDDVKDTAATSPTDPAVTSADDDVKDTAATAPAGPTPTNAGDDAKDTASTAATDPAPAEPVPTADTDTDTDTSSTTDANHAPGTDPAPPTKPRPAVHAPRAAIAAAPTHAALAASATPAGPVVMPTSESEAPALVTATPAPTGAAAEGSALAWLDPATVRAVPLPAAGPIVAPDLLSGVVRHRSRAGWIPVAGMGVLAGAYVATTLLWPTTALPPTVSKITVESSAVAATNPTWPAEGEAGVGVTGLGFASSSAVATPMASITKVVTVMAVLQEHPLALGEQGPEFEFTWQDSNTYWQYLRNNESALDVPVDGTLTEYEMIEGIVLGSAGNYTDRLAEWVWDSDEAYAEAANAWLQKAGVGGVTVVEPTGIDSGNVATPEGLIQLAEAAMQDPVFAEIAAKPSTTLPGAGLVENTNGLIDDPGVVGVKTGWLEGFNLLSAKDLTIGSDTIRTYAVVLGQEDVAAREGESRALYDQLEADLQPQVSVRAGTPVAKVRTAWGAETTIRTAEDAKVSLWRTASDVASKPALGDSTEAGAAAGTLTSTSIFGDVTVPLELKDELPGPGAWWRLTHPLELFGLR